MPREYRDGDGRRNGTPGATGCRGGVDDVAERWGLTPDGVPGYGFLSVVWPVRATGPAGLWCLKIHDDSAGTDGERIALATARGPALVGAVERGPDGERAAPGTLDPSHTLLDLGSDEACGVIGDLVTPGDPGPAVPRRRGGPHPHEHHGDARPHAGRPAPGGGRPRPVGGILLVLKTIGLTAFGVYCLAWAANRRR